MPTVTIVGDASQGGVYLLRLALEQPLTLVVGRLQRGAPVSLPLGDYVYIGSALAQRSSTALAPRLLRHATRSGERPAHVIRPALLDACQQHGLVVPQPMLPAGKRLFWHIDFLLDQPTVHLTQIIALRTALALEQPLAQWLAADPNTASVAPGFGASDHPGATHLLRVTAPASWWVSLAQRMHHLWMEHSHDRRTGPAATETPL